jgi:hypothetical protein
MPATQTTTPAAPSAPRPPTQIIFRPGKPGDDGSAPRSVHGQLIDPGAVQTIIGPTLAGGPPSTQVKLSNGEEGIVEIEKAALEKLLAPPTAPAPQL